jgi:prophage regulatory protein
MEEQISKSGFLRLSQIVGDSKKGIPPLIPVSKSTWWNGVKSGRYPRPVKISERCTAWPTESIRALIEDVKD